MATLSTPPLPAAHRETPRIEAPQWLRLWHLTSLDAPTVAVCWTLAFAWCVGIRLPLWLAAVVGLSAWSFYIADRLLDARRARTPLRPRHHFHWRHRAVFLPIAVGCAAAALGLVLLKMPLRNEARDSLLAAAAVAYFTGVHTQSEHGSGWRNSFPAKELLVAVLFTTACSAPVLSRATHRIDLLPVLAIFAAVAWLNCFAIERWESGAARLNRGRHNESGIVWSGIVWRAGVLLAVACVLSAGVAALLHQPRTSLLLASAAVSALLLALLDRYRERLAPTALRGAADLVLLTPAAVLAFGMFLPW